MIQFAVMRVRLAQIVVLAFFLIVLVTGLLVYKDYGIPWDEPDQIYIATQNQNYIFHHDPTLLSIRDRYYGMVFELPILWLTTYTSVPRHLLVYLVFFLGLIVFYFLAQRLLRSTWWSLFTTAMLAASPRIFADSFFNSKDIPFLIIGIAAVWTLVLLSDSIRRRGGGWSLAGLVILHSLMSAAMIGTRIPGVLIIPLTLFVLVVDLIQFPASWVKIIPAFAGYVVLTTGLIILMWPILWNSPLTQFLAAFDKMSRLPYDISMLFMGKFILASKLPWNYLPAWVGITTPMIVLAGFLPGVAGWLRLFWTGWRERNTGLPRRGQLLNTHTLNWTIVILWLAVPVAAVYHYHSVLYDGWRHMFFIYAPIVLISTLGLKTVYQWLLNLIHRPIGIRIGFGLLMIVGLAEPVWFMARYHPYENVYFNFLAGNPATVRSRYEMDYWGLSYKQGIDYILAHDPRPQIRIAVANNPGDFYIKDRLTRAQQARIVEVRDPSNADYFVTNFRWHPQDYPYPDEVFSALVRGETIMAVFRIQGVAKGP